MEHQFSIPQVTEVRRAHVAASSSVSEHRPSQPEIVRTPLLSGTTMDDDGFCALAAAVRQVPASH
jgi:hypothetical protein